MRNSANGTPKFIMPPTMVMSAACRRRGVAMLSPLGIGPPGEQTPGRSGYFSALALVVTSVALANASGNPS